jgi:hypothetical protein
MYQIQKVAFKGAHISVGCCLKARKERMYVVLAIYAVSDFGRKIQIQRICKPFAQENIWL